MCSIDYDYQADVCDTEWRRTRRARACCECSRVLDIGERYESTRILGDGYWTTWSTCASCSAIRKYLLDETEARRLPESEHHDDCQAFYFGGLAEACAQVVQGLAEGWMPPPHGPVAPPKFRDGAHMGAA